MKDLIAFFIFFFGTVLGVLMMLTESPFADYVIISMVFLGLHQMWKLEKDEKEDEAI